jgi:HPt (histidine-containing phosphotransfer) domain-containing protein
LVVEPTPVGRQLAEVLLRERGHEPVVVATAADALARMAAVPVDLVVLDADRPELRIAAAGFCAVLPRPLNPLQLDAVLASCREPAVDRITLLDQLGGNDSLLRPMAQLLESSARAWDAGLTAAVAASDAEAIRRLGHQAKGALGNFAATRAVATAQALEALGKTADLDGVEVLLAEFNAEVRRVQLALGGLLAE